MLVNIMFIKLLCSFLILERKTRLLPFFGYNIKVMDSDNTENTATTKPTTSFNEIRN